MMEWPCFSSSLARVKTASAPSPLSCETRDAILRFAMRSSLSFRGGRRRDGDAQTVNEARKHFERGGGQKQFDEFRIRKIGAQFGEECVVNGTTPEAELVSEAKSEFFFSGVRAAFTIGDGGNLFFGGAFLS